MRHDTRSHEADLVKPDIKQQPGPAAQQRTLGANPPPLPSQAPEREGVWHAGDRRSRRKGDDVPLDPQHDDLDALVLGPTGSDGDITDPDVARVFKEEQIGHGEDSGRDHAWHEMKMRGRGETDVTVGDLDVNLEDANFVGEEAMGGGNVPQDANDVEEIGRSVGVTFQDNEPLDIEHKLQARDDDRWELNPASAEDWEERKHRDEHADREGHQAPRVDIHKPRK
jgi:hypothetical protein